MDTKAVYLTLRQELLDSYHRQTNLVTLTFTATAAIIGFGFAPNNRIPFIFLLPLPILWLSLMQLTNAMYLVFTISVYIKTFIEPQYDIPKWETHISSLRKHLRNNAVDFKPLQNFNPITTFDVYHYARAIYVMGSICTVLCSAFAYYWGISNLEFNLAITFSVLSLLWWFHIGSRLSRPINFIREGKFEEELKEKWQKYMEADNQEKPPQRSKTSTASGKNWRHISIVESIRITTR